ncbi:MAG TPA: Bax inhibitor-1/YccA family protein [Acidiferrobacteraceae bacterium]|nr:Bax inhibitor-1/YccA family protein [Acidiferrobacteraceae bacterium]
MVQISQSISQGRDQALATNRLIRNTYMLLSMTLLFSAAMAGVALANNAPMPNIWLVLGGYFGLLFLTNYLRNSAWGLLSVFALTGFMGYTLGPVINIYLNLYSNGSQLVAYALGSTGAIFLGLSLYVLTTRKDFSYMGGFLMAGILVAFIAGVANIFLAMPILALVVSSMFVLLMCGLILWQTSAMVHGGETNYIMATVTLYVALYNLFTSLLQILGIFGGED